MSDAFKPLLGKLADGATLTEADAETFFAAALRGEPTPAQVAAAVTAMRLRGETVGEITACARVMRRAALALVHPHQVIDVCGTGGTGVSTFNVSTAVAFVAAGAGLKVAKHGNRTMTRRSGSADVLTELGVNISANLAQQRAALDGAGVCFLFAPAHHGAMRHVLPIRQELGFRTVFNLLGPLANPAGAQRQVLGVYDSRWVEPLARVLGALGVERAWVVHGDGLDEMTTSGTTQVAEWREGGVRLFNVTPEAVGLPRASLADLSGGEPAANAGAIRHLLGGRKGPYRDIVLLNAAAALLVGDKVESLREGVAMAAASIDEGRAAAALQRLVEATNRP
jgi:anthranilate phosphoribosyltransferase